MSLIDTTFKDNKSLHFLKQHLVFHVFCVNRLNISAITSIHHFLKLIVEQSHYVYTTQRICISQIIESESEFKHFSGRWSCSSAPLSHVLVYGAAM
ncbi:hypothetical protein T07_10348 [Trichinella nelsoni]|uniref:Uncharacterized protein n=1 Tax=Trichinella nelsoni TaxID=6336 RepID=A0A0V0RDD7_9BILA|nr:hypothetical protein T07_10348 [Trichinella nelsoni]